MSEPSHPARTAPWAQDSLQGHAPAAAPRRRFRPEIQGLRAFAVVLVAVYHIWFGRVSGGVDVFLFISAFLMSLSFTGKLERGQRVGWRQLSTYWVHVFKRILPLAVITVVCVLIGARLLLSSDRWVGLIRESVAVLLYGQNWYSIAQAVDYYAVDSGAASPLRHFWSLSVQGQIFVLWPVLFALGGLIARIFRISARPVLMVLFTGVFIASLTYSIQETQVDQVGADFNTFARLWEFALGTMVAIIMPWVCPPSWLRALMSWVGLLAIVSCGIVLDVRGAFPGWIALWPTGAAAIVILAGRSQRWWGIDRLLTWKPLVALGGYSYALYLLHWPILVFYLDHSGQDKAGFMGGAGVLFLSLIGAVILTHLVEMPLQRWSWPEKSRWRALVVVGLCLILGLGVAGGWRMHIDHAVQRAHERADVDNPGALVLAPDYLYAGSENPAILPLQAELHEDLAFFQLGQTCQEAAGITPGGLKGNECYAPRWEKNASGTMVAVGNSHTEQWMPALIAEAKRRDQNLVFLRQPGCFFTTASDNWFQEGCQRWIPKAERAIEDLDPQTLIIQSTMTNEHGEEWIREGTEEQVARWTEKGINVIGIRDNPRFEVSHAECLEHGTVRECTYPQGETALEDPTLPWESEHPGYAAVGFNDLICPEELCPPSIGNVYTYVDTNHLTATYVGSAKPFVDERLDQARQRIQAYREALPPPSGAGE